jgi:hypothetical protein
VGGNGYSSAPVVTIDPSPSGGTQATATAQIYTAPTEIGMVVASPQAGISFPLAWRAQTIPYPADILDGRLGGVPDPANRGPAMVQIGTEGGLLPNPVVLYNTPVGYEENKNNIIVLNVKEKTLFLAPAERADVVVDFSKFAGQTVILYNDSTAPVPAGDIRWDLYTGNPDNTGSGGAPSTLAGMGPNTRTIMAFRVSGTKGTTVPDHYPTNLVANLTTNLPALFKTEQPAPVVPAAAYNTIGYSGGQPTNKFSRIQDNSLTFTPYGSTFPVTMYMQPKCIQELFDDVGRLNATLGTEVPLTTGMNQTTIPLNFVDPATEVFTDGETQIWKITHNGVDTHGIHFHLFDVQVVNRVGWDGQIYPPDPNELGWKDTVRMDPLTDTIVAMRAVKPDLSGVAWGGAVPTSERLLNPALPTNSVLGFSNLDPLTGNQFAPAIQNVWTNFGWEYTWHCHILGHEEDDMMRPVVLNVPLNPPTAPSGLAANYVPNSGTPALSRVDLTWVDNAPTEIGFKIVRSITSDFTGTLVTNVLPVNSTSFSDTTVGNATATYYYRVYAFNSAGSSTLPSNTAKVVIAFGPTAPTGLTATPSVLSTLAPTIALAWTDNAINEANFVVQRDTNPGFTAPTTYLLPANTAAVPATVGAMTYTQTSAMGIAEATTYYYRVRATNSVGPSAWTSIVTATTPGRLPIAPSNVRSGGATRTTILMRWNDNANNETGFNVYRGPTSAGPWTLAATVGANTTSYTLAGLTRATTYYARVIAFNANGQSTAATSTAMPTSP